MKNNHGITIITLVITIIVIILIASITIFTGLNTVNSVRVKEAKDIVNVVHLALMSNEENIQYNGKSIKEQDNITNKNFSNEDYEMMGLDYTTDDCKVTLNKSVSGDIIYYTYTYTNSSGKTFDNIQHTEYAERSKTNTIEAFDKNRGVNRPVLFESDMVPINEKGEKVNNVFTDNWYNYEKNISQYARMQYKGKTYVWIPRFAYKIQDFYIGSSYSTTPDNAVDIVFLREDTDYMANDEVLKEGYLVHPAFESGISGFWIMVEPNEETISIEVAVTNTRIFNNKGTKIGHLLKNSEYAATALLSKFLNNNEIKYESKEFVAAIYTDGADTAEDFDIYTSDYRAVNYIGNVKGHALIDTPWDLKKETIIPESASGYKYLLRDIENGGMFYFEVSGGNEPASCRSVLVEKK